MTELRSTSFLVLLFVSSSGLLTNSVQAEGVQIDTNPVDNDAKLNAEYQNQGTWTRNANGSIDLKLYQNYIITKYLETQSLLDSICSLKDGSNGCQPYRLRAEIDLKKFFRSLGKTVKFFDNYLLKYRQQRRERHQKKQNQKKLKPKKQHKKKKNHRPNNSGPAAKEAVFVQAVPTTSAPANARETKSPSATQGPKSPRSTRGPSSATKSPGATRVPSVTRAPSVTRVAPANSRAPARATKGPNVTRNPEFSRAPESSRASGGVSATPPSAVKIR